ncbi:MAG: hypothetical protein HN350_21855 [Phycisphaerales bacterium]|jgi:hypothetical protein|nr:hypothetical protein [Phycisphaerales bacterium]
MANPFTTLASRLFSGFINDQVSQQLRTALAYTETDTTLKIGAHSWNTADRDSDPTSRDDILDQALEAWRVNPVARRLVGLTTQYVVGGGVEFSCDREKASDFLNDLWDHRLNRMTTRLYEFCDELTRSGNLFILISTDPSGMTFFRAVPAQDIDRIEHQPNDIEQPTAFYPKGSIEEPNPPAYIAHRPEHDALSPAGAFPVVMRHYTINRPVGAQWGESDLSPLLKWISRYSNWLEDRARLNRYRTAYMYAVKARYNNEAERSKRQMELNSRPPTPGSILVTDESEEWSVIEPRLSSDDAASDGLAIKKMIAAGAGVPMHFLAEPESSTRTTAEASGGPTYRHFEQRQKIFLWIIKDLLTIALQRRASVDRRFSARNLPEIDMSAGDISARDNVSLSLSAANINAAFSGLRDRQLIDDAELLRILYRFVGEPLDIEDMLARGEAAPPPVIPVDRPGNQAPGIDNSVVDQDTGEEKPRGGYLE